MSNSKVSIILPVINETFSLEKTVEILLFENKETIEEILIIIAARTSEASRKVIERIKNQYPYLIKVHSQKLPFLGGAMREAFALAQGRWVIMMASDLETDPHAVKDLIRETMTGDWDIITATRWAEKRGFRAYNPIKLILNFIFQKIFQLLYRTKLSDLTYGFRIFKTELVKKINWEELRHPFLFETIVKPLKLGYKIKEIPTKWEARKEGKSQNTFWRNFAYLRIGLKVFFSKREKLLKSNS